jgi:APA family basic amino acid/polyamine antiporter
VLRAREPEAPRPFRAWLYPAAPAVYVAVSVAIVINGLVHDPGPTGAGALIILAGIPLYYFFSRRTRAT